MKVKFYTVASLYALFEANEKGTLGKFLRKTEKINLLIPDELGDILLH